MVAGLRHIGMEVPGLKPGEFSMFFAHIFFYILVTVLLEYLDRTFSHV